MSNRRFFLKQLANFTALAAFPVGNAVASRSHVIIVGAGVAGTHAAAYLKMSNPSVSVTLFASSAKLFDENTFYAIQNKYKPVSRDVLTALDVGLYTDKVAQIDAGAKTVYLASGKSYRSDFLIVAPGVEFKWQSLPGYYAGMETKATHAWQHPGTEQHQNLWQQVKSMSDGESVVITVPQAPYRFPQGPYQRAVKIAKYLQRYKPKSKVMIIDSNEALPHKRHVFTHGQSDLVEGMLEWIPRSKVGDIEFPDIKNRVISLGGESVKAGVLNIIPPQQAARVVKLAGLNVETDWCPVFKDNLESRYFPEVYVLGDANDADNYNKTASYAAQHAIHCVNDIKHKLA